MEETVRSSKVVYLPCQTHPHPTDVPVSLLESASILRIKKETWTTLTESRPLPFHFTLKWWWWHDANEP